MSKGWEYHHDGTGDIALWNGCLKLNVNSTLGGTDDISGFYIYSDKALTGSINALMTIENTSSANRPNLKIINDATQNGLYIDQNGNGVSLNIDSEATTQPVYQADMAVADGNASFIHKHGGTAKFQLIRKDAVNDNVIMKLGAYYFWVDSTGDFRISSTLPSADTSGTVVGTQA